MLKQSLSQKLLQKLSPQQIQLMKLLQVPTIALEQRIKEEIETNPALEESDSELNETVETTEDDFYDNERFMNDSEGSGENLQSESSMNEQVSDEDRYEEPMREEEVSIDEYLVNYAEDDTSDYKLNADLYSPDEEEKTLPVKVETSFHDYLESQIGVLNLKDEREVKIAKQIIGSIDDEGYLTRLPIAIVDDLVFSQNVPADLHEVEAILKKIQLLDPPGVGASTLQESLILQLQRKNDNPDMDYESKATIRLALRILTDYFDEFVKKHYPKLERNLNISEKQLKKAIDEIVKLSPKPASGYVEANASQNVQYIVPDFIIETRDGELELHLNSRNTPDLRVSDQYREMLRSYDINRKHHKLTRSDKEAILFIKQKIDSARWFIDAIKQRQETMLKTMNAILYMQYDYFLSGDQKKIKPMILKDIAEVTSLDISTVSRVANSKYVQTEFGTHRLKEFFSESLQTDSGEEVSTLEVKKILKDIISNENKKRPLSDEHLKILLTEKGYNIARRTVAKYREQLNIPVARLRKSI